MKPSRHRLYIGGRWCEAAGTQHLDLVNPATGVRIARVPSADAEDARRAAQAARDAFAGWSLTPVAERVAALERIRAGLAARADEAAALISAQMGAPLAFAKAAQVGLALRNLEAAVEAAPTLCAEEAIGNTLVLREPIGVVAAITPWNFPLHQITAKLAPALVAGCTVVLKPSELTPLDAGLLAEVIDGVGLPPGVFNLVHGTGPVVGEALAADPEVDMVSFTGSTRAGLRVAQLAGASIKKLALELGGKSANVLLDDADLDTVVPIAVAQCFANAGQICAALSRLLVPHHLLEKVEALAAEAARGWCVGDPLDPRTQMGPLASHQQQQRVQASIRSGIDSGARLLCGGLGVAPDLPAGLQRGAYVRPTVFGRVHNQMQIAQEEIFGPVLAILGYGSDDEAVRLANDSPYGLSGGVWSADPVRAQGVARRLRTGHVVINGAPLNVRAPFGGCKRSGLGREYGRHGLEEYVQLKSLQGAVAA